MEHQVFAEMLGNYGEFLGAIAVVVTLAYLATQIRQNTIAQRTNSQHIVSQGFNHVNLLLAQDRELLNLMYRGNQDFFSLSEEETMVYVNYTTPFLRTYEDAYSDYLRGLLEEEYWSARQGNLKAYVAMEGVQQFWGNEGVGPYGRSSADLFRSEFAELITELMAESRTSESSSA